MTPGDLADYPVTSTQDSYMLGQTIVFLIITHIYKFSNWGGLNPVGILNTDITFTVIGMRYQIYHRN